MKPGKHFFQQTMREVEMDRRQFEVDLKAAFRMDNADYARLLAVAPGGVLAELIDALKQANRCDWQRICEVHACERAQEACTEFRDGNLLWRDGECIWCLYWSEIDGALKAAGCHCRLGLIQAAGFVFRAEIERIRDRRLGPPELRDGIDPETLDHNPTLGDLMESEHEA